MASPGLLAHITVSKYQDGLPLYRQETILNRIGIQLPRATLANWTIQAGTLIQPVINLLRDRLLAYDIIQMDEAPVQVLKEPGKTAQSKSYLWLQRGGPPDQVEKRVRPLMPDERDQQRQQEAQPILDRLRVWLDDVLPQVPPASATGKALNYLHNEWDKLIRYLDDGCLEIDNNGAENAIRPFVVGRKNWLFSASVKGVKASANLYSLI